MEVDPSAHDVEDLICILVRLVIDGNDALFIMSYRDGRMQRLGDGSPDNTEQQTLIGTTGEPVFERLCLKVNPNWFGHGGTHQQPGVRGKNCELTLSFQFTDKQEIGLTYLYGSESKGPPRDVVEFVTYAAHVTNGWYESQKQKVGDTVAAVARRPWWKLW
jgi:hypothetical protein